MDYEKLAAQLQSQIDDLEELYKDLLEENKRFRAALEELDSMNDSGEGSKFCVRQVIRTAGLY